MNARLSILDMAAKGYWFCTACEMVTELRDDGRGGNCCSRCGCGHIVHYSAVFDQVAVDEPGAGAVATNAVVTTGSQ